MPATWDWRGVLAGEKQVSEPPPLKLRHAFAATESLQALPAWQRGLFGHGTPGRVIEIGMTSRIAVVRASRLPEFGEIAAVAGCPHAGEWAPSFLADRADAIWTESARLLDAGTMPLYGPCPDDLTVVVNPVSRPFCDPNRTPDDNGIDSPSSIVSLIRLDGEHFGEPLYADVAVAVVVQKMIASESAGVAFSVHPVTQDYDQMVIEACWGLGEALVSGMITPDTFVVSKSTGDILESYVSEQEKTIVRAEDGNGTVTKDVAPNKKGEQKITQEMLTELSGVVQNIEKHYGKPMDIEWAIEDGKLYLTQARPITTLS